MKKSNLKRIMKQLCIVCLFAILLCPTAYAAGADVAGSATSAFDTYMKPQIKAIANGVIIPCIDGILAVVIIVKAIMLWQSYKKNGGEYEWHSLAVLGGCLVVALSAPLWMWTMIGW